MDIAILLIVMGVWLWLGLKENKNSAKDIFAYLDNGEELFDYESYRETLT